MQPTMMAAVAIAGAARGAAAACVSHDVFAGAPFALNSAPGLQDNDDIAVARCSDTTAIVCYLAWAPDIYDVRGACNLVEGGATVGDTLMHMTGPTSGDATFHSAMAPLTDRTTIWCYVDMEESFVLQCRKVNRDDNILSVEPAGEISIISNPELGEAMRVDVKGSSVISATRFSNTRAVVCADNPGERVNMHPRPTGPLACAMLLINPADPDDVLRVSSNTGSNIVSLSTGSILTLSIISFDESRGAVCYTSSEAGGNRVSCTHLTLSGSTEWDGALTVGATVVISADAGSAAAVALSADTGIVCYAGGAAAAMSCSRLHDEGDVLIKVGDIMQVSQEAVSDLALEAFSSETAVACFQWKLQWDGHRAACYAMNTEAEDGSLGDALTIDDVEAGTSIMEFALTSMTDTAGLLCYRNSAGAGVCRELQVLPGTTCTETRTETSTSTATGTSTETRTSVTETSATETSTTSHTAISNETSTSGTETSATSHTTTQLTATEITTTETTTTETTTTIAVKDLLSGATGGAAAAAGWTAAALLAALDFFAR